MATFIKSQMGDMITEVYMRKNTMVRITYREDTKLLIRDVKIETSAYPNPSELRRDWKRISDNDFNTALKRATAHLLRDENSDYVLIKKDSLIDLPNADFIHDEVSVGVRRR